MKTDVTAATVQDRIVRDFMASPVIACFTVPFVLVLVDGMSSAVLSLRRMPAMMMKRGVGGLTSIRSWCRGGGFARGGRYRERVTRPTASLAKPVLHLR